MPRVTLTPNQGVSPRPCSPSRRSTPVGLRASGRACMTTVFSTAAGRPRVQAFGPKGHPPPAPHAAQREAAGGRGGLLQPPLP